MLNSLIKNEYASKDLMRKRIVSKTTNIPLYKTIAKQLLCLTTWKSHLRFTLQEN